MLSKLLDAFGIGRKRKPVTERKARYQGYRSISLPGEDGDIIEARIPNDGGMATFHNVLSQLNERRIPYFDSDGYPTWNDKEVKRHRYEQSSSRGSTQPSDTYTHAPAYVASNYSYDSSPSSCDTSTSSSTSSDCSF